MMTRYCHDDYEHTDMFMITNSEFTASFRIFNASEMQEAYQATSLHSCLSNICFTESLVVKSFSFRNTFKPVNW